MYRINAFNFPFSFLGCILLCGIDTRAQMGIPTQIDPTSFPPVPKQLTVKVEMVLPEEKFVEEFVVVWDEELNLARYDYALGRIMAPFNTSRPMKTIHDYNNGISFNMDGVMPNCTMHPLNYLLTEANMTGLSYRLRRLVGVGNVTMNGLLRSLHPKQLFYMNEKDRVHNMTLKETIRGIPCDVWTVFDDDFYIPGYGIAKTRHRLYFMTKEFTRTLVGEVPHMIPVQRVVYLMEFGRPGGMFGTQQPRVIFNYFDFTVPVVPTLYDLSISQCIPKGKIEARESIQFRFPGNFSGMRPEHFIPQFRRSALKKIMQVGELSPLRVVGVFPSQDNQSMYVTATVLPRPPPQLHFTKVQEGVKRKSSQLIMPAIDTDQFATCARSCMQSTMGCNKMAWCTRDDNPNSILRRCVIRYGEDSPTKLTNQTGALGLLSTSSSNTTMRSDVQFTCDVYQKIINSGTYDGPVLESLFKLLLDVQELHFKVSVEFNNVTVQLQAEDMRTDVSLNEDSTNPTTLSDSRSSFEMYRGHTKIINAGARDQLSKLSPSECRRHCLDEKRFTCQSVASCVYGDCIISDLHGDELLNDTNGQANIGAHTHCVVWTRSWKGMFTLASLLVPQAAPDRVLTGVSSEDTCAKQCLFGNFSCESFSYCSSSGVSPFSGNRLGPSKGQHECQLYRNHAFDVLQEPRTHRPGCWHLSRNYVQDFESSPGYELDETIQPDVTWVEIEPALERWHCAKECIDKLGDDGCLAFDICEEITGLVIDDDTSHASLSDLIRQVDSSVRCRISSSYLGIVTNSTAVKKVKDNENCTLYTRTVYLDGTSVNPKTVAAQKKDNSLDLSSLKQSAALVAAHAAAVNAKKDKSGYTISDMAGIAIGMLVVGVVLTAACMVLMYRSNDAPGVAFRRDIPFVRFT